MKKSDDYYRVDTPSIHRDRRRAYYIHLKDTLKSTCRMAPVVFFVCVACTAFTAMAIPPGSPAANLRGWALFFSISGIAASTFLYVAARLRLKKLIREGKGD